MSTPTKGYRKPLSFFTTLDAYDAASGIIFTAVTSIQTNPLTSPVVSADVRTAAGAPRVLTAVTCVSGVVNIQGTSFTAGDTAQIFLTFV